MKTFIKVIKNYFLCQKYKFLKMYNVYTGKFCGYHSTWYDFIPSGWKKAFGKDLCKELKKALKKDKFYKKFRIIEVKEKYGTLRIYHFGISDRAYQVINKYEKMSWDYCINCGEKALYDTYDFNLYICPYCEKCFKEIVKSRLKNYTFEGKKFEELKEKCKKDKEENEMEM